MIALSDRENIFEAGEAFSTYMQDRFEVGKRVMNRYLKKIRELGIYTPIEGKPNAFRGLPLLYNRLQVLPSLWEFKNVQTEHEWVFGEGFGNWLLKGDGSKILTSPSHVRLTNKSNKSEDKIPRTEHEKILIELKRKHTEETKMIQVAFSEILEEKIKSFEDSRLQFQADLKMITSDMKACINEALAELRKHDTVAAETLKKRHLELVKE
jgi:hypothetical protein